MRPPKVKDRLEVEASACSSSLPVLSLGTELSLHLRSDGLSSQLLSDVFRAQDQKRKRRLAFFSSRTQDQKSDFES